MRKKRVIYIDVIRVVAMMLVVLAHSCASRLSIRDGAFSWDVANGLVIITEIAVPLFFMISGATILNSKKTRNVGYLFKHRLVRVVIPFLIWSVLSAFFIRVIQRTFEMHDFLKSVALIYHQPVLMAYWFIYPLLGLYLLSPLLKALVDNIDDKLMNYLLILWIVTSIFLPNVVTSVPQQWSAYFQGYSMLFITSSSSLGYFILGYKLTQARHRQLNRTKVALIIVLLLAINIILGFLTDGNHLRYLNIISNLIIPMIAALCFTWLKSFETHYPTWLSKTIEFVAPLTYGVYLVHGLTIAVVEGLFGFHYFIPNFILSTVISLIIIFILSKIPLIKKIML
ncbi:acyltransferase [Companilactobacillus halodurans]|uniref:Acyltransferase n=1 Tax=Companilactobacillus halodurans TaxID=2584183 RepID=A0A5P0ZU83_9LACO|nr:acyltransferase [Companilactobacillus halodurans]MQS96623.1 acyltransferase [Companilactobacillus halodurans]